MIKNIVNTDEFEDHSVEKYRFKVLGGASNINEQIPKEEIIQDNVKAKELEEQLEVISSPNIEVKSDEQSQFIEELLKRSDELSSNIIKLQMQIEKQDTSFEERLQNELKREGESSYEKGYQKGKEELLASVEDIKAKYFNSINVLEEECKKSDEYLKKIESELSSTAIEVAKEVISLEVKNSSSDIAIALSKKLIEELKDAKNIELKVNPKDLESLKNEKFEIENLKISSDLSITEGGVIVLSDAGNLDGNLSTRVGKVKNLIENS